MRNQNKIKELLTEHFSKLIDEKGSIMLTKENVASVIRGSINRVYEADNLSKGITPGFREQTINGDVDAIIRNKLVRLAMLNASSDITLEEFEERRTTVAFLERHKVIELGIPKELGKFVLTSKEFQDLYVEAYNAKKMEIAKEATMKLDGVYMLVLWPTSQLIMDEEWFDKECHLADMEKDPSVKNSAYFVPVKRLDVLESKLREIAKIKEIEHES